MFWSLHPSLQMVSSLFLKKNYLINIILNLSKLSVFKDYGVFYSMDLLFQLLHSFLAILVCQHVSWTSNRLLILKDHNNTFHKLDIVLLLSFSLSLVSSQLLFSTYVESQLQNILMLLLVLWLMLQEQF
jgi:hypothetical protein